MRRFLILFLVSCFVSNASAQIEEIRRITKQLCAPEFHGRGYVNQGDFIAAQYIIAEFKKLGVSAYKKESFEQNFAIQGINRFPKNMSVQQGEVRFTPGVHFMVDPSSAGGKLALTPQVLSGTELIKDTESGLNETYLRAEIEKLGENETNAFLIDLGGLSDEEAKRIYGLSEALAEIAPTIEVRNGKFTYSVGHDQLKHPLIFLQDSVYVEGVAFQIDIDAELIDSYDTQNVIAYIPAKKKCSKTVVFTAHYDHLGRMGEDTYFPGGNDNASGTAMLLTMAKYFKENPSDYNILFIAFAGEEAGLLGSKYYVEHPFFALKKIRFLINLDIMGSGEEGITAVNATLFEEEFKILQDINTEQNLLSQVKKRGPAANSDHYWFTQAGVPAFFIYTMGPNKNYHDVFDTYENLSFEEYEDITQLLITFVGRL